MPLSEEELRLLEQMERALVEEDPKFASTLRGTSLRRSARRRAIARRRRLRARHRAAHGRRDERQGRRSASRSASPASWSCSARPPSPSPRSAASSTPRPADPRHGHAPLPRLHRHRRRPHRPDPPPPPLRPPRPPAPSWSAWKSAGAAAANKAGSDLHRSASGFGSGPALVARVRPCGPESARRHATPCRGRLLPARCVRRPAPRRVGASCRRRSSTHPHSAHCGSVGSSVRARPAPPPGWLRRASAGPRRVRR